MVVTGRDLVGEIGDFRGGLAGVKKIVVAYRRGKFYIRLQFVRLAAGAFLLLV